MVPATKETWILGAFIHSRPLVIHYGSYDVIYAGANDGMLHAFKDSNGTTGDDGTELWGFIPPDLLPNLKNFNNSLASLQIFVDGSPKAYVTYNYNADGSIQSVSQAILIFGERRGGNQYYALDVTNPTAPKFLWSISPSRSYPVQPQLIRQHIKNWDKVGAPRYLGRLRMGLEQSGWLLSGADTMIQMRTTVPLLQIQREEPFMLLISRMEAKFGSTHTVMIRI